MGTATGSVYFDGFPPQGRSGGSLKSEFLPPPAFVPVSETTGLPRAVDILQAAVVTAIGHNRKQPAVEMSFLE
jgi:hypothetical protein